MPTRRLRAVALPVAILVLLAAVLATWAAVPAARLAPTGLYLLLSALPGVPLAQVNHVLGQPEVQTVRFTGAEGEIVADLYLPPGGGRHPTMLVVNGALEDGRKYPALAQFAGALARSGYTTLVPDYPDLLHEELTPASLQDVEETLQHLPTLPGVQADHVELVGFCVGATLGLLAAEDPRMPPVRAVVDLAGYVSARDMIQLVSTDSYTYDGRLHHFATDPWVVVAVARSLVAGLPDASDRDIFAPFLQDPSPTNYVAPDWSKVPADRLSAGGRALLALLENRDPLNVPSLMAALPPPMPEQLASMSPETGFDHLRAPVYIVADRSDTYIPSAESLSLQAARPGLVHLSYVSLLAHVEPDLTAQSNPLATVADVASGAWQLLSAIEQVLLALR